MSQVSDKGFVYSIPDVLNGKLKFSKVYVNYGVMEKETTFGIDLSLPEMSLSKTLRSRDLDLLPGKVEETLHRWEAKYQRFLEAKYQAEKEATVEDRNREASAALDVLDNILAHTLDVHDAVDWNSIKIKEGFRASPASLFDDGHAPDFVRFDESGKPTGYDEAERPAKPTLDQVKSEYGLVTQLLKDTRIQQDYDKRLQQWSENEARAQQDSADRTAKYEQALARFEQQSAEFDEEKARNNRALDDIQERYKNSDARAIEEYCDLVLNSSEYPDYFPKNWILEYRTDKRQLVVEYELPFSDRLPKAASYKYDTATDQIVESPLPESDRNQIYDRLVYQVCIRTIHEVCEADVIGALDAVIFNGFVTIVSPATGQKQTSTILSVSSGKSEFMSFDLSQVQPKATFEHLKGISAASPCDMSAIEPITTIEQSEREYL